jgi:diguanylate cyclase (GGDEF)-like protein/PAS domain S-box-containing protein
MREFQAKKVYFFIGVCLLILSATNLVGWLTNDVHLTTLFTNTAPLGFLAVWSLVFSGFLFILKSKDITPTITKTKWILTNLVIANSLLAIFFCLTKFSPYIYFFPDGQFVDYFTNARSIIPHLAWALAGFLMYHTTFQLNTKKLAYLETINFILLFLGIQGIVQSLHHFDLVYMWLNNFAMPLPYSIGLTLVNIGMIIVWGDIRSSINMGGTEEDRQIKFFSTSMLTQAIMSSVFFGAMIFASQNETFLRSALEKYVALKSMILTDSIKNEQDELSRTIDSLDSMLSKNKTTHLTAKNLPDLGLFLKSQNFTAAKITNTDGAIIYKYGNFNPEVHHSLFIKDKYKTQLIRNDGWHILFKAPITSNTKKIGFIELEKPIFSITELINSRNKFSDSEIKAVCSQLTNGSANCLSSNSETDQDWNINAFNPFTTKLSGQAFIDETKFNRHNIAVTENLGDSGLKLVLLLNADEIEKNLRNQMYIALPIIGLFILFFLRMLNWHILPIFRRSINAEKDAIESARMLSDNESRIRAIIDNIGECVIVFSEDGKVDSINQTALSAFNIPNINQKSINIYDLFNVSQQDFQQFLYTSYGQWRDTKCRRMDGSEFDAQLKFKDIHTRQKHLFIAIIRDVTDQKISETKLTQSEKVFRNSFDHAPIGMMVLNMRNTIIRVNQSLCTMLGYVESELIGVNIKALLPEHLRIENSLPFVKLTEIGIKNYSIESPMLTKSGEVISTVSSMTLFLSASEEDSFFVTQIQNVTMQQKYEAELRQTNDELQNKFKELKNHTRITEELNNMNGILQACLTIAEALDPIEKFADKLFDDIQGAVYLSTPETGQMELALRWGEVNDNVDLIRKEDCWALRRSQPYIVKDPHDQVTCYHYDNAMIEGQICIPLTAQGELIGLMTIYSVDASFKETSNDLTRLAMSFADHIALSLSNIRLRERLQHQSIIDALTNLHNRRYFDESLKIEISRAERKTQPISLLIIDIDHFKKFNDTYGHDVGDLVLQEVSGVLKKNIRASDIACRMGGEEFVIILPDSTTNTAHERAEILRQKIEKIVLKNAGKVIDPITVSIGIATYPDHAHTAKHLIEAADMALYAAKNQGRNRCITAASLTSHESLKGKPEPRYTPKQK